MLLVSVLLTGWTLSTAKAANGTHWDLLEILTDELNREFAGLKAKGDPPPYYLAYEVTEEQTTLVAATLGALLTDSESHIREASTLPSESARRRSTIITHTKIRARTSRILRRLVWVTTANEIRRSSLGGNGSRVSGEPRAACCSSRPTSNYWWRTKRRMPIFPVDPAVKYARAA